MPSSRHSMDHNHPPTVARTDEDMFTAFSCVNRIAIIGAGPTGVACAKHLLAEKAFTKIDVFEQRSNVGGIWNLSGTERTRRIPIPQTNSTYGANKDLSSDGTADSTSLEFESPLYDYLETNIPKTMMAYSENPMADHLPLYPKHDDVLRYLEDYAEPVRSLIQFGTQVVGVKPVIRTEDSSEQHRLNQRWHVTTKTLDTDVLTKSQYDAVIVSNGHYTVPHVPSVPGLADWNTKYPGVVMHSKAYRKPEDFTAKKVLVIGNSASGLDIAGQIAGCAQQPVYLASRSASQLAPSGGGPAWRKDVAEIEEFVVDRGDRTVRTKNGEHIEGLDAIVFATGYFYSFPFISSQSITSVTSSNNASRSDSPASDSTSSSADTKNQESSAQQSFNPLENLTTTGLRTHNVYKHFLHTTYPTLALPVLNLKVVPFPLAENQAAVIARLWSGRLDLPSDSEMHDWERNEEQRLLEANRLRPAPDTASGDAVTSNSHEHAQEQESETGKPDSRYEGGFHTLIYPEDAAQINTLYQWAASARRRDGLQNDGVGKLGTRWDEFQVWKRKQFPNIKADYAKLGDNRSEVTRLEDLEGWQGAYERWCAETSEGEKRDLFRRAGVMGY